MKKIFIIISASIAIGFVIFLFHNQFLQSLLNLQDRYLPCSRPIKYSLGSFDKKFNISREKFLSIVNIAEKTWEKPIDKQLFIYVPNGKNDLKINLIYDTRQEASQKLKDIGITVNNNQTSFNKFKLKYNIMQTNYKKLKIKLKSKIILFQNRQNEYKKEVKYFNANGGAPQNEIGRASCRERV